MTFEYAAIARNDVILAQNAITSGNFDVILGGVLKQITTSDARFQSEKSQHKIFTERLESNLIFAVIGGTDLGASEAYSFLKRLQTSFLIQHGRNWSTAQPFAFQNEFGPKIKLLLAEPKKLETIHNNINQANERMQNSLKEAYLRGNSLQNLETKTDNLFSTSAEFERKANEVRRKMFCEQNRYYIIGFISVSVIILLIVIFSLAKKKSN